MDVFWDFLQCGSGYNRRFGEHITSIFRIPDGEGTTQLFYFWYAFTAVSIIYLSGTLYSVVQVRTDVSEEISPPSSGSLRVIGHYYRKEP
jgi:hypothetical protein